MMLYGGQLLLRNQKASNCLLLARFILRCLWTMMPLNIFVMPLEALTYSSRLVTWSRKRCQIFCQILASPLAFPRLSHCCVTCSMGLPMVHSHSEPNEHIFSSLSRSGRVALFPEIFSTMAHDALDAGVPPPDPGAPGKQA